MSKVNANLLTWVEINQLALANNIKIFRHLIGPKVLLAPCVKANAYGHGLVESSKIAVQAGADWLAVNALFEAEMLRSAGIKCPIYITGYVMKKKLAQAVKLGCRLVIYNKETIKKLADVAEKQNKKAFVHIKVETGTNRQGIPQKDVLDFVNFVKKFPHIEVEGLTTHFANIEDRINDEYAQFQLNNFRKTLETLETHGVKIPIPNCANSAAAILFPESHFRLVRPGISVYGLWPSEKTEIAAKKMHRYIELEPVLCWKTRIAQIKNIEKGTYVGYGCTHKTKRKTRLAVLPVGYYEGYDRGFSSKGYVLIHGKRAKVLGRVCMNMIMVDVTKIPQARVEDTVTLLGRDGREEITAEYLAELIGTINYEITARINENIPRVVV